MSRKKPIFRLRTTITLLVCGVVALALLVTGTLVSQKVAESTQSTLEEKAMNIARMMAHSPTIIQAMEGKTDPKQIQTISNEMTKITNVEFIVVFDMHGIRKSHPDVTQIGKHFVGGDEGPVLQGQEHISIAKGTLGMSLRAFSPIRSSNGIQLGAVAVGISLDEVGLAVQKSRSIIYIGIVFGILVGILGAIVLARKIKNAMFGLEPIEIAMVLEERSAMLHSAKEGIIVVDETCTITLMNYEAVRLFTLAGFTQEWRGKCIDEFIPNSPMKEVLQTETAELDQELDLNGITLLVNSVPILVNKKIVGVIATFRDKTEMKRLVEQLSGVRLYAEALRTQAHEFMNKLHVISGLIQLEHYDDLDKYVMRIADQQQTEFGFIVKRIKDPVLAGFILGKLSYAREMGVDLVFGKECFLPEPEDPQVIHDLVTVFGNLIDNAIEAIETSMNKSVYVYFYYKNGIVSLLVSDNGPGIDENTKRSMFTKGMSAKGDNRGFGLYLVQRSIEKRNGTIEVISEIGKGTTFKVQLPYLCKSPHS